MPDEQEPRRETVRARVATSHRLEAYGGTEASEGLLQHLATELASGRLSVVANHDFMKPMHGKVNWAKVVPLPDGHKAVDIEIEVDTVAWEAFQEELTARQAPGGWSFTIAETFQSINAEEPIASGSFHLSADADFFSRDVIREAGEQLAPTAPTTLGMLYQFADPHACRVIIEYVQEGSLPDLANIAIGVGIGVISAAVYDCLKVLLKGRKPPEDGDSPKTQVDFVTQRDADGRIRQVLTVTTDELDVVRRALDSVDTALQLPNAALGWDDDSQSWREPDV